MKKFLPILIIALATVSGCITLGEKNLEDRLSKPGSRNFRFVVFDSAIDNPDNDQRCYYRVFIDKVDSGRTTTGLESQEKSFEAVLAPNRHLVRVEKWVLDEKKGRYEKLNNVKQPKPAYHYFVIPRGEDVTVTMSVGKGRRANFSVKAE